MDKQLIIDAIITQGILPLYYHENANTSIALAKTLYKAGIRVIEYTNRGEYAIGNFKALIAERNKTMPNLLLGIGTIKTINDANNFLNAGADFIICPIVLSGVAEVVHQANKLWIPGCMTVTEIAIAEAAGAKMVKLFPGNILGAAFVSAIKELFPQLLFMPTGGVDTNKESIATWFKAGVAAVGMGSKIISKQQMDSKDYATIEADTKLVLSLIQQIKKEL